MSHGTDDFERQHRAMLLRKRRLRRVLKRLPRRANLARYPVLKRFAQYARKAPFLWSFRQPHVISSLYVGSVLAFLPLYGIQALLAFAAALMVRGNLTVMVALQFITNPLTAAPIYAFTRWVGVKIMGLLGVGDTMHVALQWTHALFIGGVVVGLGFALLAHATWRLLAWEARVFRERLAHLRERRRQAAEQAEAEAAAASSVQDASAQDAQGAARRDASGPSA